MHRVCVISAEQTPFGRSEEPGREMLIDAASRAVTSAGISPKDVQAGYVSTCFGFLEMQGHYGPLLMSALGIPEVPCTSVESACASGSSAIREAYMSIAGGFYDCVLVAGFERVMHLDTLKATTYFTMGCDRVFEGVHGATFPGLYAVMARAYFDRYGAAEEDLAHIAVKNHANAMDNPNAHLKKRIDVGDVMRSPYVASPLKLYDCCPFSDGAAAALLCSEGFARRYAQEYIEVVSSARSGGPLALHDGADLTSIPSAVRAGAEALARSRMERRDVDLLEVHDCFTIAEAVALEDLGFAPRGEGASLAREGVTLRDGDLPVNTSGGLKAKGHPVGATGIAQVVEVVDQMFCRAGRRQVDGATTALTHNVGATGGSCSVHIFRRVR